MMASYIVILLQMYVIVHCTEASSDAGPLRDAVFEDDITSELQWVDIVQRLQDNGYKDAVVEVLAATTVRAAMHSAASHTHNLQHSEAENVENQAAEGEEKQAGEDSEKDNQEGKEEDEGGPKAVNDD